MVAVFSEELAGTIDEALTLNDRPEFRFEMLRLIERGGIRGCMTFVRESALRVEAECEDFEAECAAYNAEDEKTQAILIGISEVLNTYGQNLSRCLEAVERVSQSEFYTGIKVPFS